MSALPVPAPDPASAPFFAALDAGRLELLCCLRCGAPHLAPLVCNICGHDEFRPQPASGHATIYSVTRVHIAHHPAFVDQLPVCAGIVELAEGPRLFAPLRGSGRFAIGDPVMLELIPADGRNVAAFRRCDRT